MLKGRYGLGWMIVGWLVLAALLALGILGVYTLTTPLVTMSGGAQTR